MSYRFAGELVWLLKADIVCLDYDGGFWDAAVMALHLALSSTKLPVIEYSPENERFVLQENTLVDLPVGKFPLATSFGVFQVQNVLSSKKSPHFLISE